MDNTLLVQKGHGTLTEPSQEHRPQLTTHSQILLDNLAANQEREETK